MSTTNLINREIYNNSVVLDDETGLPEDYNSFFAAYWPLMMATAERLNIPHQDRADASQEVQLKFWLKNGLDMFDPDRGTQFSTLLRNWATLFMLQERDKVIKSQKVIPIDTADYIREDHLVYQPEAESRERSYVHAEFIQTWLRDAQETLKRLECTHLLPVLSACVEAAENATAPSRAQIAEAAGVKISKATPMLKELRKVLDDAGMGMESLYSTYEF